MKLPPIKLRRLYAKNDKAQCGGFMIIAEPLPADVHARMTDDEHIARRKAEQRAIDAEWAKVQRSTSAKK